ncbi:MAG: hypothetical protein JSW71_11555 [Gemmatimonadota bacterium]|nr:MAG: hypothetical protein JSW71_11555 [Gemmatimonadota bacterium]
MIRSHKLLGTASLPLILCLALTGCWTDLPSTDFDSRIDEIVLLSDWLGEYGGAATARVYATSSVYSDVSGHITMEQVSQDSIHVRLSVGVSPRPDDLEDIGDFTGGPLGPAGIGWDLVTPLESVSSNSALSVTYQSGIRRKRLSLTRSGERLTGLLYVDHQKTDGAYEIAGRIEVDVVKLP